jgi:hypothetical protein
MITIEQYWMGRDSTHADELTDEIRANGADTVSRVNGVLTEFFADTGIDMSVVASGWRPKAINEHTSNSGATSKHIIGLACDIRDTDNRDFARWCCTHGSVLGEFGLYMERADYTPSWVHLGAAPKSLKRYYIPNSNPPLCARLDEQNTGNC